jgi:phage-related protein
MTDDNRKRNEQTDEEVSRVHFDIDYLSAAGNIVIAGRNGSLSVNTGGDVDQNSTVTMTVGGVQATQEQFDDLLRSVRNLENTIKNEISDPEENEVAQHNLKTMLEQLMGKKKPNGRILVQAARVLYKLSPAVAGAVLSVFSEPLVEKIITATGGIAMQFYQALMTRGG